MDFDTLVDFDDYFDNATDAEDSFDLGGITEDTGLPTTMPEPEPLPVPEYQEYKPIEAESRVEEPKLEEVRVEQLRSDIDRANQEGSFKEFWNKLSDKDKDLLFRVTMGTVGGGAREALRNVQQTRAQEFQREMTDREYAERRAREEREAEARRIAGTPQAMSFSAQPRGIIGQGMGG